MLQFPINSNFYFPPRTSLKVKLQGRKTMNNRILSCSESSSRIQHQENLDYFASSHYFLLAYEENCMGSVLQSQEVNKLAGLHHLPEREKEIQHMHDFVSEKTPCLM